MSMLRVQFLCLRSLPAATPNCQQIRLHTTQKLLAPIKIRIDSEAVDGLTAAALFDLDAKETNPETCFNKRTVISKKQKKKHTT